MTATATSDSKTPASGATAIIPAISTPTAQAPAKTIKAKPVPKPKVAAKIVKAVEKTVVKAVVKPAVKVAEKAAVKTVKVTKPAKPAKALKAASAVKVEKSAKAEKTEKEKKPKLVRDSFTIPKAEYDLLSALKARAIRLKQPAKKGELLRAGIKLLVGLSDTAFRAALVAIPALKTGRPASAPVAKKA